MMFVTRMFGISIVVVFASAIIKKSNPTISNTIMFTGAICIILSSISGIIVVIDLLRDMTQKANIGNQYLKAMLQITGTGILLKLLLSFIKDTGSDTLRFAIELGGRLCILLIALPFIFQAISVLSELLQ